MTPQLAIEYLWLVWVISWLAAALWSERTAERPPVGSELLYRIVTLAGAAMLFGFVSRSYHNPLGLWSLGAGLNWALFGICAGGFIFCWWARLHLGKLWSGWITRKEGHHIVDTGPYGIVRHPIYTGLIASAFATAVMKGTIVALAGATVMTLGFWIKARLEERFLREQLGADAYDAYRRRVPMLLPFGPKAA
ncbi:MAG TPA: isoprenylcysteine carboxylmethyltransferase family protein [Rhizomicrobium sp.]|jgi:protein-S-isoprenylcysteine O-methyltransferase Ste14|nr:isoprenylcysteine carboxylmethyltransferase family protein [Rhizomicrobium sp.]